MLLNDYSQLPVMTGDRTVHGLISWKSIGEHMWSGRQDHESWTAWTPRSECCLATCPYFGQWAKSSNTRSCSFKIGPKKIVGIVTTTDLSVQLRDLTDAFPLDRQHRKTDQAVDR